MWLYCRGRWSELRRWGGSFAWVRGFVAAVGRCCVGWFVVLFIILLMLLVASKTAVTGLVAFFALVTVSFINLTISTPKIEEAFIDRAGELRRKLIAAVFCALRLLMFEGMSP